ncbi:DUF4405 domain-containing protein [Roseospira navarrensis]|uniref:DUF4405 domain-containing protein n=1 Tax=Roseospira navarrensis TaxID=140058 RepID=A0A7X2D4Y4_9PROT|nr:DUF4405 domain-containing protein [Roseospira navarrensis]MQX38408.1 DUF4405 domain-containing protein [Roseospira navarrensis]
MSASKTMTRDIVTPVTIVLFVVSTVTGVMLLLHWQGGLVRFSHEWLSLVFSAVAVWHLVKNWRPFMAYLKRRLALVALGVSLAASVVITGLTGSTASVSPGAVFHAMAEAPLSTAAPALGLEAPAALALLRDAGIEATGGETLAVIGARSGLGAPGVMTLLAQGPTGEDH